MPDETPAVLETPKGGEVPGDETFDLINDGQVTQVTREKVIADAQKGRHVLPKVQSELAQLQKDLDAANTQAEGSVEFVGDFKTAVTDAGGKAKRPSTGSGRQWGGPKPRWNTSWVTKAWRVNKAEEKGISCPAPHPSQSRVLGVTGCPRRSR